MKRKSLYLGCTIDTHKRLGAHAPVNARAGEQWRNMDTLEETEMKRDARKIADRVKSRVRFYQFNSRFFRRHQARLQHLISDPNEI
jgi:predicted GIY-YIG superfamily endonuclease